MGLRRIIMLGLASAVLAGCQHGNAAQEQKAALTLSTDSMALRQAQMRRFDTSDERILLTAASGVLQDLGFNLEESSAAAGLIVASKDRDAIESGQVAGQLVLAALITALGGRADPVWGRDQKIRISVVTRPSTSAAAVVVRVTFQRLIWNTKNQIARVESIDDPAIYQEFFDKLSQSVFLEANQI